MCVSLWRIEQTKELCSSATRLLGEWHPSKNMPALSLNWHGASLADSLQGANFMMNRDLVQYSMDSRQTDRLTIIVSDIHDIPIIIILS